MVVPHLMHVIPWILLVRVHGGASFNGCNSMNLMVRVHGSVSCMDVIPRRFRGGASRP